MPSWNRNAAVNHLTDSAENGSLGKCAAYVREAIEAGGITLERTLSAKNYGPKLTSAGFTELNFTPMRYQPGDVAIIQAIPGHPHGHMCMYNGTNWVSDFVQRDMYPGPTYRKLHPEFAVYRWKWSLTGDSSASLPLTF